MKRVAFVAGGVLLVLILGAVGVGAYVLSNANAALTTGSTSLAQIQMPSVGGKIESVSAVIGQDDTPLPVDIRGDSIYPTKMIPVGQPVTIDVVIQRPSWNSWLTGKTEHLQISVKTPAAHLREHFLTVPSGNQLQLHFAQPVQVVSYGTIGGKLTRTVLATPQADVSLPRTALAGSIWVSAAPRAWESSRPAVVSWFPAGNGVTAVATPSPGTQIKSGTPITLTFSKPVSAALRDGAPTVSPAGSGTWHTIGSHAIQFEPTGYGYGLGATVTVSVPKDVTIVGGKHVGSDPSATWTVPQGSTLRLQQLLAELGYLPVSFKSAHPVARTPTAQEAAAVDPPKGAFSWRWANTPSQVTSMWQAGTYGEMTKGAIMAFENNENMTADGVAGPALWKALINAALSHQVSTFGYTFVMVSENSPETIDVWHSGRTALTGLVNTGIPEAPTAEGVFAVFEHALSVTMSGTNPDGSHYSDPGVPYVSYFNGGDALHGFLRASYGFEQSLGCVEMPYSEAATVYPYTPIGTLVDVS